MPVIPIVGAKKLTQFEDNLRSVDLKLSAEQIGRLDKVSAVAPGFPHDFFEFDPVKAIVFGGLRDRIKA